MLLGNFKFIVCLNISSLSIVVCFCLSVLFSASEEICTTISCTYVSFSDCVCVCLCFCLSVGVCVSVFLSLCVSLCVSECVCV